MLKIMIVDDEFYFREALKVSLPWSELGFEICGEAKNGKDALEKAGALNPEIIIVDINMPIMDGLEFVQHIREEGSDSKIIILTGHSEFNYAKQAVQLGVYNYILKPVNEDELKSALLDLKKIIQKEENIKIETDRLKLQIRDSLPLLKDKFLNELMQGHFIKKENDIVKKMEYLKISISSEYNLVAAIELDYEGNPGWNDEDRQLWKFAVSNISDDILSGHFSFERCYDYDDRICLIIGSGRNVNKEEFASLLEYKLEFLRATIQKHLGFTITIGVGSVKSELYDIAASYKEAMIALKNKITIGKNKVISYCSVAESEIRGNLFTVEHRSQILMNMRIANDAEVRRLIAQIFENMRRDNVNYELLFVICIEMISACLEFIVEVGIGFRDIFHNNQLDIIEQIQLKKSIDEMENWIEEIYRYTLDAVKRNKSSKASKLIEEVKKYIRDNYQNSELSVDEIARNLYVNYAHLCFIFKRDAGITINDYLTEFRIKRAKELFDTGDALVLDVAGKVGYADANYFGKCFKKFYGLAPSKYIENKR